MIARNDNMEIQPTLQRQLAPKLESHNESTSLPTATYTADHNSFSHKNFTLPQSFRRQRKGRACRTCHERRIRCDAASLGVPCTNCVAFSIECFIPPRQKKKRAVENHTNGLKRQRAKSNPEVVDLENGSSLPSQKTPSPNQSSSTFSRRMTDPQVEEQPDHIKAYAQIIEPALSEAPIKEAGKVAYLVERSVMSLLVHDYGGPEPSDIVHYPLPKSYTDAIDGPSKLDKVEIGILQRQGALSLPPKELCDELVESYFKWVAPVVPIINRSRFMRQYQDPSNPPSLLLLHAICLAGSRVCTKMQLMDSNGSPISAATLFYQRAKALYDANYEEDRVALVQALILMGWYWEEPVKVTRNVFYWLGLAVTVAQGFGMHRNAERSRLSTVDKRLWKRIWWTLFTRDRSVAAALGRPVQINMDDSDVGMVCEDDFIEDEPGFPTDIQPNPVHVNYFVQYVKICEIMDLVLAQHYSIASRARRNHSLALTQCDLALAGWLQNCPAEVRWDESEYRFWSALLYCSYYTTSCLLHRAHLPPPPKPGLHHEQNPELHLYPRRNPAYQSACAITTIMESLIIHNDICYTPPFIIYSLVSALLVLIYEMHKAVPDTYLSLKKRILVCMHSLDKLSKTWLVAKMSYDLFVCIIEQVGFEDCLEEVRRNEKREIGGNEDIGSEPGKCTMKDGLTLAPPISPKASRPILTPALLDHMDAALKSLSLSENTHPSMGSPGVINSTLLSQPLQPPGLTDEEQSLSYQSVRSAQRSPSISIFISSLLEENFPTHKNLGEPPNTNTHQGFHELSSFPIELMENIQPHQLFPEDPAYNIWMPEYSSEIRNQYPNLATETSSWNMYNEDLQFQMPQDLQEESPVLEVSRHQLWSLSG